jgi:hypothetical protein
MSGKESTNSSDLRERVTSANAKVTGTNVLSTKIRGVPSLPTDMAQLEFKSE